jgi:hypothetical protein
LGKTPPVPRVPTTRPQQETLRQGPDAWASSPRAISRTAAVLTPTAFEVFVFSFTKPHPCESGFCNHRGANLSNCQVRPWPRQSRHARRPWRHAGDVRSRPGTGAGGRGGAHGVSSGSAMSNPAANFEPYRRRQLGLAYRMLGSVADAEDAVQETYLRWHGADGGKVSDPRAFLMTTTTR